jgi:hypothetical protein
MMPHDILWYKSQGVSLKCSMNQTCDIKETYVCVYIYMPIYNIIYICTVDLVVNNLDLSYDSDLSRYVFLYMCTHKVGPSSYVCLFITTIS